MSIFTLIYTLCVDLFPYLILSIFEAVITSCNMNNKCCVVNYDSKRKDVSLHMFSKSEIGLQKWLQCINCERLRRLRSMSRFLASKRDRARLQLEAIPTLFTASEILSGITQAAALICYNTDRVGHDHDYSKKRRHFDHTYCVPEIVEKCSKPDSKVDIISLIENLNLPSTSRLESVATKKPITDDVVNCTPSTKRRRRVVNIKNKLTPHCEFLYKEHIKSRNQLNFHRRAKKALKFSKQKSFLQLTEKMNPLAKKFLWMQIKQCTKKARGTRFTNGDNETEPKML